MKLEVVPVTAFQQNCSVLWCEKTRRAAIVDPGGDLERVLSVIESHGLTLEKILITHAHLDHAGATAELARRYSLPIEGPHLGDQFWINQMPAQAKMFGHALQSSAMCCLLVRSDVPTFRVATMPI